MMNIGSPTGIGISASDHAENSCAGPLLLSVAIHVIAVIALAYVQFGPAPARPLIPSRTFIVVGPLALPRTLTPTRLLRSPVRARIPAVAPAPIPGARAFRVPSPRGLMRPTLAVVELPFAALDSPVTPPVLATSPYLPTFPPPPLKTNNLAPAASTPPAVPAGRIEVAGFGTRAAPQAYSRHTPPSTVGGFATATLARAAPPDPVPSSPAGFGDASVSAATGASARTPDPQEASTSPIEILEKPRPLYTKEARDLRLEGEVLIEALFPAAGPASVVRVLRGLGHGLDEAAMAAVREIRFRPAKRAGQAVDSTAIVRIAFQIAY